MSERSSASPPRSSCAPDGRVLLAQRPAGKAYAGYWEFPGGKLEPGETPRRRARPRAAEELGLAVRRAAPWLVQRYVYPHAHVELHFFRVFEWDGEPVGHDGQAFAWQTPGRFDVRAAAAGEHVRAARAAAAAGLRDHDGGRPRRDGVSGTRAKPRSTGGLTLIQLREKDWPAERQRAFAAALVALARPRGARVLLNGDADDARAWGCDGVHLTSAALAATAVRPGADDLLCAASCHTRAEIERAGALGLDFAVLGPVSADAVASGRAGAGLGRLRGDRRARRRCRSSRWAASTARDLDVAIAHGAHGVALRRAAWRCGTSPPSARSTGYDDVAARAVARAGGGSGASGSGASATGTRYASLAHAPRSIILQRSEQNGRQRDAGVHSTGLRRSAGRRRRAAAVTDCRTPARTRRRGRRRVPRSMPDTPMKRMLSAYLLALISGTHGRSCGDREPQELRDLRRRQHQLEDAAIARSAGSRGRCRAGGAG